MDRSEIMRRVRDRDTTPERVVRRLLREIGQPGYRLNRKDLPGSPDIAYIGRRNAIFVHGCFWHGHDCKRGARQPKRNAEYWRSKIERNRTRDAKANGELRARGWRVVTIWECELRDLDATRRRLRDFFA
ncbi:MAG: very short patch repair endonuclease [Pseudomonadota bacterium]